VLRADAVRDAAPDALPAGAREAFSQLAPAIADVALPGLRATRARIVELLTDEWLKNDPPPAREFSAILLKLVGSAATLAGRILLRKGPGPRRD
jgi:hypothetical protein